MPSRPVRRAVVVLVAVLAGFVVLVPGAQGGEIYNAFVNGWSSRPTIVPGATGQAAGNWGLYTPGAYEVGDTFTLRIDDADAAENCASPGDSIGFTSLPVLSAGDPVRSAHLTLSLSSSPACASSGVKDVLTFTAGRATGYDERLELSQIAYSVGTIVAPGTVRYAVSGSVPAFSSDYSNATISTAVVTAGDPPILVPPTSARTVMGDVRIAERRAGALSSSVCVQVRYPDGVSLDTGATPVVTAVAGDGTPGPVSVSSTGISFTTRPGSSPTTYRLSGMAVRAAPEANGWIALDVGLTCGTGDLAFATPAGRVGSVGRVTGSDRYATAAAIATSALPNGVVNGAVVIARGDAFPDALAAAYLAGTESAPILLTRPGDLPSATVDALRQLGASRVILVGGTGSIGAAVEQQLRSLPVYPFGSSTPTATRLTVTRISGADRYATAAAIATSKSKDYVGRIDLGLTGTICQPTRTAIVASGTAFPDALAAGGLARAGAHRFACGDSGGGLPLLLTASDALPLPTITALKQLGVEQVILMGGTATVSPAVAAQLASQAGVRVLRVAGANRQDTAVQLATTVLAPLAGWTEAYWSRNGTVIVARGDSYPDALAGSLVSGMLHGPIFLSGSSTDLGPVTTAGILRWNAQTGTALVLGGTASLGPGVEAQLATAMATPR